MTPETMATLIDSNEIIRFYGQLIGTPGLDADNNKTVNIYLALLLDAQETSVKGLCEKLRANSSGLITK